VRFPEIFTGRGPTLRRAGRYCAVVVDAYERFVASGPLRIWTERAGIPALPAVLLVMGSAAQGVSCPDGLVDRLVERGVEVIRFDHRDTGRSSVVDFDQDPAYPLGHGEALAAAIPARSGTSGRGWAMS
jgi:alpha-beta hydrolase superfamily lysophospholipase